jgi:hypothetical protein
MDIVFDFLVSKQCVSTLYCISLVLFCIFRGRELTLFSNQDFQFIRLFLCSISLSKGGKYELEKHAYWQMVYPVSYDKLDIMWGFNSCYSKEYGAYSPWAALLLRFSL